MIRVINVRRLRRPVQQLGVCYVGRHCADWPGTPWGNPYRSDPPHTLETCLARYREWAESRPPEWLAELWAECRQGAKPLGCWCCDATAGDGSPLTCHAQILAELLTTRYGPKEPS